MIHVFFLLLSCEWFQDLFMISKVFVVPDCSFRCTQKLRKVPLYQNQTPRAQIKLHIHVAPDKALISIENGQDFFLFLHEMKTYVVGTH